MTDYTELDKEELHTHLQNALARRMMRLNSLEVARSRAYALEAEYHEADDEVATLTVALYNAREGSE